MNNHLPSQDPHPGQNNQMHFLDRASLFLHENPVVPFVLVGLLLILALTISFSSCTASVAAMLKGEVNVTESFTEYLESVRGNNGDVLEVAILKSNFTARRDDTYRIAWGGLNLGTTVTELSCPVTSRYHVRLTDDWVVAVSGNACVVIAPPVRPSLPAAIHLDELRMRSEQGWARFNGDESRALVQRMAAAKIDEQAKAGARKPEVMNAARQSIEGFVRRWVVKSGRGQESILSVVKVHFPGELSKEQETEIRRMAEAGDREVSVSGGEL